MKRILSAAVIPIIATLDACSGGSSTATSPVKTAVTVDSGAQTGDDGSAVGTGDDTMGTGDDGNTAIEYDAPLTGAQVVPPVMTASTGLARFFLQEDGVTLAYTIDLSMVPNPTAVSVHVGAAGDVTPVAHSLAPLGPTMTGQIVLTADEASSLTIDQLYVDVKTMAHPGGEVRAQIALPMATVLVAHPTGAQEVPPVMSAYATGSHAAFVLSPDMTTVNYHVVTAATPTNILIEHGIAGLNGAILVGLNLGSPTAPGTYDGVLQITDATPYVNGEIYVNVETAAHQTGELRGQIIDPGETLFSSTMSGMNEVPPNMSQATGAIQVILDPTQTSIRYEVVVSGAVPQAIALYTGAPGQPAGTPWYQLTLGASGAMGMQMLATGDAAQLIGGGVFADVFTPSYSTTGELRGQLVEQ